MENKTIQNFIENFILEYTGTGGGGGNAGDGNNITSPRPFPDDTTEILSYTLKSIYGGDGGHYKGEPVTQNPNRVKMTMFENLKNLIKKELKEQAYGSATLTTQGPPRTGAIAPTDEYPFSVRPKRTATGMMEFKQPKSFDPDTINLVRDMLSIADVHHNELVGGYDEISSFLDKRSGGTYIKFPHFNGPQGRGALFGKETSDQIDSSKAKAKAAALKTYTQFKDYIEDYEISDVSPAGVYGNAYLFLIFNELAKDYTSPKGGTISSQFETIEEEEVHGKEIVITASGLKKAIEFMGKHLKNLPNYASNRLFNLFKVDNIKALISNFPYNSEESKADLSKLKSLFKQMEPEEAKNFGLEINKLHTDMKRKNLKEATCRQKSQELADSYSTEELQDRLDQIFRDMEQEAEPEGGPIADMYADEIEAYEGAIKIAKGGSDKPLTYGQATGQEPLPDGSYLDKDGNKTTVSPNKDTFTKSSKFDRLKEQTVDPDQKAYETGLKRLQKGVIQFQLRYIEKQKAKSLAQAATASGDASKGFNDQIEALKDQIKAIDNPPKQDQKESLYREYIKLRTHSNLMEYMDAHKRQPLMEGTVKKFFKMFTKGKTNEEIFKHYAKKGITIPEQLLSKIRKQYENTQKLKLELEFSEQEAKDIVFKPVIPQAQLFNMGDDDDKKMSTKIYQEKELKEHIQKEITLLTEKQYEAPEELINLIKNDLKMNPLIRFIDKFKAANTIPPSYRVFLLNGKTFDVYYETFSLMVKINEKEYYIGDLDERNYAIKHINRLLQEPMTTPGTDGEGTGETGETGETTPPPTPPSTEEPAEDEA